MSIQKYEAFLKTVELGSLSKAAEALQYTQSGISHILSSLEKEWGVTLLQRDRSGVRMTSDAVHLYPLIQIACNANKDLMNEISELNGLQTGHVRIGSFFSVSVHWLPKIISEFQLQYPNINFEIQHGNYMEIEQWIMEGRVDFGFLRVPIRIDAEMLQCDTDQLVAVLPAGHPLSSESSFPIAQFQDEPFVLLEEGEENEMLSLLKQYNISPKVRFSSKDDYSIMAMVESGLGVSILHSLVLHRNPFNLVIRPLDRPAYRDIAMVLRSHRRASTATKRFITFAKEFMKSNSFDFSYRI